MRSPRFFLALFALAKQILELVHELVQVFASGPAVRGPERPARSDRLLLRCDHRAFSLRSSPLRSRSLSSSMNSFRSLRSGPQSAGPSDPLVPIAFSFDAITALFPCALRPCEADP